MRSRIRDVRAASLVYHWFGRSIFATLLIGIFGILASRPQLSRADEVYLKNGNRITGVIKQTDKQRVILEVSGLGTIVLDQTEIASIKETPIEVPEVHTAIGERNESEVKKIEKNATSASQLRRVGSGSAGVRPARFSGQCEDGIVAYASHQYQSALTLFKPCADQGDPLAAALMACIYGDSKGKHWDQNAAIQVLLPAARQGPGFPVGAEQGTLNQLLFRASYTTTNVGIQPKLSEADRVHVIRFVVSMGADVNAEWGSTHVTPLILASDSGDAPVVEALLEAGADPNRGDKDGLGALELSERKAPKIAMLLRDHGARPKLQESVAKRQTPPRPQRAPTLQDGFAAFEEGKHKKALELLKPYADQGDVRASVIVAYLYLGGGYAGGDEDKAFTVLLQAAQRGQAAPVRIYGSDLSDRAAKETFLFSVMVSDKLPGDQKQAIVKFLLSIGTDVNRHFSTGWTPLIMAAHHGDLSLVKLLFANGADPNLASKDGVTPLMYAAEQGSVEVAQALLAKGANLNAKDAAGGTAMSRAVWIGAMNRRPADLVKLFISKGADINAIEPRAGQSLLIAACVAGHIEYVKLLLSKGANPNLKDRLGKTALMYARQYRWVELEPILKQAGAKE